MISLLICLALSGAPEAPNYPDHFDLLAVKNGAGDSEPITRPAEWDVRKAHILAHLQEVMGPLPGGERRVPLDVQVLEEHDEPLYVRRKITYASEPGDRVPAWLLIPKTGPSPHPAALCLHPTSPVGKDVVVGLSDKVNRDYAKELAERGYVTIAPDYPTLGENQTDAYALGYTSCSMKAVWNHMRAIDLLCSMPEVDPSKIAAIGHSLGGHNAIFVALFDDRVKAIVSSCGFNAFKDYYQGDLTGWSGPRYMPLLKSRYDLDLKKIPFDWPELLAAVAPRGVFVNAPLHDSNFEVEGVRACVEPASKVFALLGRPDNLQVVYPDAEHDFPMELHRRVYGFVDRVLGVSRDNPPSR